MNRLCVNFHGIGFVPVHADEDYVFMTYPPRKIGDEAIIRVNGSRKHVMLLRSSGHVKDETYLVQVRV